MNSLKATAMLAWNIFCVIFIHCCFNIAIASAPNERSHSSNIKLVTEYYRKMRYECMRDNIFYEARNQSERGQYAVAFVTMNRRHNKQYPSTICEVVWEGRENKTPSNPNTCQFSWVCKNMAMPDLSNPSELQAWQRAERIAREVIDGRINSFIGNATHFHLVGAEPSWTKSPRFTRITIIDDHVFYAIKQ